jgi:alpha-galactosidase
MPDYDRGAKGGGIDRLQEETLNRLMVNRKEITTMFRRHIILSIATCLWPVASLWAQAVSPAPAEMAEAEQWSKKLENLPQAKGEDTFFSFIYDGKPSVELLNAWKRSQTSRKLDDHRTERTTTWTDPKTSLEVRCTSVAYSDFPVVEWTVYFKNTGKADTPIIENIQGMDIAFHREGEGEFTLRTIRGDDCAPTSYQPIEEKLAKGAIRRFASAGGRPTYGAFPYFNVEWSGQGALAVIGWPGQWAAQFDYDQASVLKIRGGQELTKLKLLPGEEIRTPLSLLMFWKGDAVRSQNIWRKWMLAHNAPKMHGKPAKPATYTMGPTAIALLPVADAEIAAIDDLVKSGNKFDYWWIDAGWYPCNGVWQNTGTWEPDPVRFPKGIKQVSDYAHEKGMKFVLWFEPERIAPNSWLTQNHSQWIFGGANGGLLNEGNPEARQWLIDYIDQFIKKQGVDLYREDFNIDPLGYWRGNDAPDRQGITENLYVQGHLAYWDELLRRNPEIMIDSCASGGRRNDLETLRRAVPLLRSDYKGNGSPEVIVANQGHTYGLSMWIPFHGTGEFFNDAYSFRSHICPAMGTANDPTKTPVDFKPLKKILEDWHAVAPEFFGDYYPLTPYNLSEDAWMAWQFNRPENGSGMVQAFRHAASADDSLRVKLQGLDPEATYILTNLDIPGTTELSGRELCENGLLIVIKEQRGAAMITYKKKI